MIYIILCLLIILGIVFPRSKYVLIFDILVISLIIGLRPYTATDYNNYWIEYNTASLIQTSKADFPGYNLLMRFCQYLGLSFNQFIIIIAFLSIILMIIGMLKLGKYVPFALSLFLIYPFAHEAVQMRTFLADSIVWCALPMLLVDQQNKIKNMRSKGLFFILTYIASTIHTLCWFYIAIAIIYLLFRDNKRYLTIIFATAIAMILLVRIGAFNIFLASASSSDKLSHWIEGSTNYGIVLYGTISLVIYIMIKYTTQSDLMKVNDLSMLKIQTNIQKFSACILLIIPFFTYDITFDRLWRIFLGLLYLESGEYLYSSKGLRWKKVVYVFCLISVIVTSFVLENEIYIIHTLMR